MIRQNKFWNRTLVFVWLVSMLFSLSFADVQAYACGQKLSHIDDMRAGTEPGQPDDGGQGELPVTPAPTLVPTFPVQSEAPVPTESGAAGSSENMTDKPNKPNKTNKADKVKKPGKQGKQGKWIVKKKGLNYRVKRKKVKGLVKIKNRYYYFDSKGVQRTGWQKIDGKYYFFRIANKEKGCMVKARKVNGITLKKSGAAKITPFSKSKLYVLEKANKIVEKATNPLMKRSEKRKKVFQYALKYFWYSGSLNFHKKKNWEIPYALDMFDKGHGNCFAYGAAFAFLANAVGDEKCYAVSSGGHGWTEVDGRVYDIS